MLKVLGEHYFFDLDEIEKYVTITNASGVTENNLNVMKYEMVKLMSEVLMSEKDDIDEALGPKSNVSVPFKMAFNSMLNKKLINKY